MAHFKLPLVDCSRGAPMGRVSRIFDAGQPCKLFLRRIYLDAQGYDNGGAYWGHGTPLYVAFSGMTTIFLRAHTRQEAKAQLRQTLPNASFFN